MPDRFILTRSCFEDFRHLAGIEFIGTQFLWNVAANLSRFQIRSVPADAENHFLIAEFPRITASEWHREAADLCRIDFFQSHLDQSRETRFAIS